MKTKILNCVLLILLTSIAFAQDLVRVDATIQLYPERFDSTDGLTAMITRDFISEEDKIRAIYGWIINNVAYDPEEYKKFNYSFKNYRERNAKEEKTRKQIIARTISRGVAVCEGYAMLFEKLCSDQGITNYLVRGDIKSNFNDIGRPFNKSHMWNVAYIDGKPHLFDPTWGAGKYNGKFIKDPSWYFYKADPRHFVKTHFPDVDEDTLLEAMVSREMYRSWPIVIDQELTLEDLGDQTSGIINAMEVSSPLRFELNMDEETDVSYTFGRDKETVDASIIDGKLVFEIPFDLGEENLLIYFNDKPALAYKIR